jgi:hypothetical protein
MSWNLKVARTTDTGNCLGKMFSSPLERFSRRDVGESTSEYNRSINTDVEHRMLCGIRSVDPKSTTLLVPRGMLTSRIMIVNMPIKRDLMLRSCKRLEQEPETGLGFSVLK